MSRAAKRKAIGKRLTKGRKRAARKKMLGKFPKPIKDHLVIKIQLVSRQFNQMNKALKSAKAKVISVKQLRTLIDKTIYAPLRKRMEFEIDVLAPEDTGSLRDALKLGVSQANVRLDYFPDQDWFVVMGTPGIPYGSVVNRMPTSWLTHPAPWHRNVGRRENSLQDPMAENRFFDKILKTSRNLAQQLVRNFINNIVGLIQPLAGIVSNLPAQARGMFRFRYR